MKALAAACDDVRARGNGFAAAPGTTQQAADVMRVAAEHGLTAAARGGGSRLGWGTPSRPDLLIDTTRMSGVLEHAAGDLVARVQAGTRMGDVSAELAKAGQELALDVPAAATVGGVVASGLAGPRRLRYGTPRDLLIGITVVRADGIVAKSGGKVVKNVAGYDLGKLFTGSDGTLGLITEATFRLHPLPAARAYVTAEYTAVSVACDAISAAANSPLVASAVEVSLTGPDAPVRVGVLLEGSAEGVESRAARMAALLGTASVAGDPPDWWPAPLAAGPDQTLIRVSFWVSALGRVLDAISAAAGQAGVRPLVEGSAGAGVLYLRLGPGGDGAPTADDVTAVSAVSAVGDAPGALAEARFAAKAQFIAKLRELAAGQRGAVTVLTATPMVRAELASFGGMTGPVPGLALMQSVKDRFDPGHRLAPGRFPAAV
jgi:glycolate oxidase FAD binding subunit